MLQFGDKPAAIGLDMAKKLVAAVGEHIDPAAAAMIAKNYINDSCSGGTDADVLRLMGKTKDLEGNSFFQGMVPMRLQHKGDDSGWRGENGNPRCVW